MTKIKKTESGKCPKCGSDYLDYSDSEQEDNFNVYEVTCEKCGCEFRETYKEVYVDSEIL